MNKAVSNVIGKLFEGVEMTEETRQLRDELAANCSDRFEDYVAEGMSELEALDRVVSSLGNVSELIAPARQGRPLEPRAASGRFGEQKQAVLPATGISGVEARLRSCQLEVHPAAGEQFALNYWGSPEQAQLIDWRVEEGRLVIEEQEGGWRGLLGLLGSRRASRLELGVPRGLMLDYRLSCGSGGVSMLDVPGRELALSCGSGGLRLALPEGVRAEQIDLNAASGGVQLTGGARRLRARTASGSTRITGDFEQAEVRSGSGGIHLSGSSGQLELHAASGGVELTGRHEQVNTNVSSGRTSLKGTFGELAVKSASGGVSVRCLSQPRSIRAGTSSGSLTITLPRELSGMRLNVRTGSGKLTNDFESDRFGDEALSVDLHAASGNIHIEKQ